MRTFSIRKVFQGVASRNQMFQIFTRHHAAPWDEARLSGALYDGEWFEVSEDAYDYMLDILPPLFMRDGMFALSERIADDITSVFFALPANGRIRWFHAYCNLADAKSIERTRLSILNRESRPVPAMSHDEKLDHIWSTTADAYRGYHGAQRRIIVYAPGGASRWEQLADLSDGEVCAKLPVHLRFLPETLAA